MRSTQIIKEDETKKISLITDNDKKYIERTINGDKRDIYKIIQRLNHPNLAKILNVSFDTETVVYEECIDGVPLSQLLDKGVALKKSAIKKIALQVISAMEALHGAGIIHRDIKPDNILVDSSCRVWLIDYDIAKIFRPQIRQDTEIKGTFGYAPPEQYGMMPTDFKTDIYAFGVTLSKLLEAAGIGGKMMKIAAKCKRLDPAERYENASKLKKALTESRKKAYVWLGLCLVVVAALAAVFLFQGGQVENDKDIKPGYGYTEKKLKDKSDLPGEDGQYDVSSDALPENKNVAQKEETQPSNEDIPEDVCFWGFDEDDTLKKYKSYNNISSACIFSTTWGMEHFMMLEDASSSGKIRLGDGNIADGNFTLENGVLTVNLWDDKGHSFAGDFKYDDKYPYDMLYTQGLSYSADVVCMDMDEDGKEELLIGLSQGVTGADGSYFYRSLNYCMGWCISYDVSLGFTLCKGEMFSRGGSFSLTQFGTIEPRMSGDYNDPMSIYIEDNEIKNVYYW